VKTNEAQFAKGEIPPADEKLFPKVVTPGVPVTTDVSEVYYRDWNNQLRKQAFTYDNEFGRLKCWLDWRNSIALERYRDRFAAGIAGFVFASGAIWPLSKMQWATRVAKAVDVSKSAGALKRYGSRGLQAVLAAVNTTGLLYFTNQMSGKEMNEALKSIMLHDIISSSEDAREIFFRSAVGAVMPHAAAIHLFGNLIEAVGDIAGVGTKPRIAKEPATKTSNVDAANPMDQDPATRKTPVDQSDSKEKEVVKPVEKEKEVVKPVEKETPKRPEDLTPAGRGAKFSAAKENGDPTVVIGGVTYRTADFKDNGRYWTGPNGESFLKN
jgi:hypothetical protein